MTPALHRASVGIALLALAGCGGSRSTTPAAAFPAVQALDTAGVLALARRSSETTTPFAVDDGSLSLTDTNDTTEPVAVVGP